ncbi:MAG: hypothetical protein RDU83_06205 [bacterium]|jgi:hypothetical protein|nr:hypothetical protein [bacterium]
MPTRKPTRGKAPDLPRHPQETVVLFVRGLPASLLREARALASLRGVNVRVVLVEALREYLRKAPDWRR